MVDARTSRPLAGHREGAGPVLLALPGIGSTLREFRAVLPALAARLDVLAVVLPGQGGSQGLPVQPRLDVPALTDAVGQELDRRGVGTPHVLGVSLGGRVGLELARRGRARSVVALAPTGPVTPPERGWQLALLGSARAAFSATAPVADVVLRPAAVRSAALAPLRAQGWATPPGEAAALVRAIGRSPGFWSALRWSVLPEATVDYRSVRCPVHIAQGTHDVLAQGQALRLAYLVPGARFSWLPFAGHSSVGDAPAAVVALVEQTARRAGRAGTAEGDAPVSGARP